jgi:hypothetical protein
MTLTHRYLEQNAAITVGAFQTKYSTRQSTWCVGAPKQHSVQKRNHRIQISLQTVGPLAFKGRGVDEHPFQG